MGSSRPPGTATPRNGLPVQLTSFIGREREIDAVKDLLARARLVTLVGPGGSGKTRLALRAATDLVDAFGDGVHFVALAPIRDPDLVVPTIGHALALGMDGVQPPLETMIEHLRDWECLLVLDNLEQVIDVGPSLAELLAACDRLKLLATSRIPLRISGEQELDVPPLSVPERIGPLDAEATAEGLEHYEAIQLFVARARAVEPGFTLSGANAAHVAQLCRRLDGMPLAIELAASRVRLLPPSVMVTRLAEPSQAPSLRLLTGGPRDQPARLQTLRGAIAWSYDLLDVAEQALFRRLAIFVGGCTLETVEAVGAADLGAGPALSPDEALDGVGALLAKTLVRRTDGNDGVPRYAMLETIREYGLESLALADELPALRAWHARHYLALVEAAESRLRGADQCAWLDRLEAEHDNLRAALEWSQTPDGDAELGLQLSGGLSWFWQVRSHIEEGRRWLTRALRHQSGPSLARVRALTGAGWLAHLQQDADTARGLLREALALARDCGDGWWAAWALHLLGRVAYFEGDADTARSLGSESLEIARAIGDQWLVAWGLHLLALAAHIESDYPSARPLYEESLAIRRELDFREGTGTILYLLGMVDFAQGDYPSAWSRFREAVAVVRSLGSRWLLGNQLASIAGLAAALGQIERAALLAGAARAMSDAVRVRPIPLVAPVLEEVTRSGQQALGHAAFEAFLAEGRRMSQERAVAEALAIAPPPAETPALTPAAAERDGAVPGGLTTREAEVLQLIAAGCTSQEIADRLVISIHTVERHITHIYQKLGVRGRAEAIAVALTQGIA
jgi:non-specific serine/threonine protein kinase